MKKQLHVFGIFTLLFLYSYAFAWQSQAKIVDRVSNDAPLSFVEKMLDMHTHVQSELPTWQSEVPSGEKSGYKAKLLLPSNSLFNFGFEPLVLSLRSEKLASQNPLQAEELIFHFYHFHDFV